KKRASQKRSRSNALKRFNSLDAPTLKYGITMKIDLSDFDFKNFAEPEIPEQKILSTKEAIILDFEEAVKKYPELTKEKFLNELTPPVNKFEAFHIANWKKATVIIIPKNTELKEPIEINTFFQNTNVDDLLVIAEQNSSATIIDSISNSGKNKYKLNSRVAEVFLESGAKINFLSVQNCDKETYTFSIKRAITEKDSVINWLDCNFGGKVCTSEATSILNGSGSQTNNYGIFFGAGEQKFDLHSKSIHVGTNTSSDMLTKGALDDSAKAIYRGVLKIHTTAFDSSGYQKEEVILLSDKAEADSIPELRINNNDIKKCTHGASIGQVDPEKLFYLMSRGLERKDAVKSLIEAFFAAVCTKMGSEAFTGKITNIVTNKLNPK
ncbi:MAG: Fe-S cluster assembly protein SufD, partial [Nanoarchaeota archaeon]